MTTPLSIALGPDTNEPEGRIDHFVKDWAGRTPDATALSWRDDNVTYAQLAQMARVMRDELCEAGVLDHDIVAVQLPRTPKLVAAMLGVLESNAAYLLLDESWPLERRQEAVHQSGAHWIITEWGTQSVADSDRTAPIADGPLCSTVFFTSGTTGRPKAVLSTHDGMVRVARDPAIGFGPDSCIFQVAPVPWDVLSLEVWGPLVMGGSVIIFDGRLPTAQDIRDAIARGANTVYLTATLFHAFVDDDATCFRGLSLLMTGAERVSSRHATQCRAAVPGLRLLNLYGPVESTVYATAFEIDDKQDPNLEVPIGWPTAGASVFVLDREGKPVARGDEGEIAISGRGLASCYLGDPQETERRFRFLPLFSDGQSVRVYLTGDRGRMADGGILEFLGRVDRQIKIRGVRVDPLETERKIEATGHVKRVAVIPIDNSIAGRHLQAFCVSTNDDRDAELITSAVRKSLPDQYVPERVHFLESFPLTPIGKIDYMALRDMASSSADHATVENRQCSSDQDVVLRHACTLLGAKIGKDDDMLGNGATSLTMIRLSNLIQADLGIQISASKMLRARTPEKIAQLLRD